MQSVRIVELPQRRAVCSGPLCTKEAFEAFNRWFSAYHASLRGELGPRDFMWYNERLGAQEWFYILPENAPESVAEGYAVKTLSAGLYAVASCLDADLDQARDWLRTRQELIDWVEKSDLFRLYSNKSDGEERYPMFHIVSPGWLMQKGISLEDLYMPIVLKT